MSRFQSPLDHVRIAAPCNADWDQMFGNDRARFCGQCNLNVYNFSSMTRAEAESFIAQTEGRLCVRFYRRKDGSILTENCPVGLRAIRRKLSSVAKALGSSVLSFFAGIGLYLGVETTAELVRPRTMGRMVRENHRPGEPDVTLGSPTFIGDLTIEKPEKESPHWLKSRRKKGHASPR